ncbi:MAG: extracellular solute-binding protein [Alphaproteobacteria bacterium]|nr:extracellular solute-binding protein [Alphaproteobacteria bacterium]
MSEPNFCRRLGRHVAVCALAGTLATFGSAETRAEGVLDGETIRILAIGDPVFQVMQRIHGDLEEMAGGTIELDVRAFDVLRQQVLLNAQNDISSYDIIAVDLPQFGEYKGFLVDLSGYVEQSGMDWQDFHDAAWVGGNHDGKQLGIPIQPHPEIFAYRTDLFEEAGLEPPRTTEQVLEAAAKLHGSKDGLSGICWNGGRGTPLGQTVTMVMGSHGLPVIAMDAIDGGFDLGNIKPENMRPQMESDTAKEMADYLMTLMEYSPPGILNMAWDERVRVFAQGGCAMTYIWSGRSAIYELDEAADARGNVAYLPHPAGPNGLNVSTLGGWFMSIPDNLPEERRDLAWSVIDWMTSPEMMVEYTKHGNCVAPRHSVSVNEEVVERCPVVPYVDAMATSGEIAGWQRPPVPEIQQIFDILGAEMHEAIAGATPPEDALASSQSQLDRIMRRAGYY